MKRIFGVLAILALATLALAADKPQTLKGHLVDVSCASENQQKPKADFRQKHGKTCLQMPECEESGYALLTADDKVIKLDKASNDQAKKFIADTNKDKDWAVVVTGSMNKDNTLKLDKIALQ
jgi:phosphoribosylamine-glycine ligase